MTCPPIDDLLEGRAADHAARCDDCRAVLDLVAARTPAGCGRAEALMAARAAGNISSDSRRLLSLHLDGCSSCAIVAGSLDAPEIADALAGAAELDRDLESARDADPALGAAARRGEPTRGVDEPRNTGDGHRRGAAVRGARPARGTRNRRRHRVVLAALALVAIAAGAALLTRALG